RNSGAAFRSIWMHRTPRLPRSIASVRPTGPAPTMRTCVVMRSESGKRSFQRPLVVRTPGAAAPVLPRPLESEGPARPQHGRDFAVAQAGWIADRARVHLQIGVHLQVNRVEDDLAQRRAGND